MRYIHDIIIYYITLLNGCHTGCFQANAVCVVSVRACIYCLISYKHFPFLGAIREIHVDSEEYVGKLIDLNCLKFVVVAKVLETGKQYVDDSKIQLNNKDCIEIKVSKYYFVSTLNL